MNNPRRAALQAALILGAAACLPLTASAQNYPTRTVKIVVPYPAGSTPDALARIVAENLSKRIQQPVVIDNKPGAGGMIGAKFVSEAAPDGNTLLMFTPAWSAAKVFMNKTPVPIPDGLEPVTMVAEGSATFVAASAVPVNSFNELVSYAKTHPGKLNFATTGMGDNYLYSLMMQREKGFTMESIQYKGSAEFMTALVANDVQVAFTPPYNMVPLAKDGRIKVLAVTGSKRLKAFPDVPSFAELGLPKIRNNWFSLFAPRGTPADMVAKLNADLSAVIKGPEASTRIQDIYFEPVGSSAAHLRTRIQTEIDEWTALARAAGIQPQ